MHINLGNNCSFAPIVYLYLKKNTNNEKLYYQESSTIIFLNIINERNFLNKKKTIKKLTLSSRSWGNRK